MVDVEPPTIVLNGENQIILSQFEAFNDPGAVANDNYDGSISVTTSGNVNTAEIGQYILQYIAVDSSGNTSTISRTIIIEEILDTTPPNISLVGESTVYVNQNASFVDLGVNAIDDVDGNLESSVTGDVDVSTIGEYVLTYTATDSSDNTASIQRTVIVQAFCVNDHPELDSSIPSVNVTFRVDMSSVVTSTDGVYIAGGGGTFDQCGYLMTDDGNDVWSVTRALEPNKQYRYLFRNQPSYGTWDGFEVGPGSQAPGACFVGEWTERIVYVWDSDIILDVVPYAGCNDPPYDWDLPPNPRNPLIDWDYQISSGSNHNCALEDSGVVCWGSNNFGQTILPALSNPTQISSGYMHSCAIDDTGVVCWGWDGNGNGQIDPPVLNEPKQVSLGDSHSCALDNSGIICWGSNNDGQRNVPNLSNPTKLSVGLHHSCAIDDNGAHCWGQNSWGESNVPELTNPIQISGGSNHTCAIDDTGVVCWGRNNFGQIDVPALSNPTIVDAGDWNTCAIDDTGVVCWGDNGAGQSNVPSLINPTDISSGYMHSCALDDLGVHCWGKNDHNQLDVPELMIDPDGDSFSNQNGVDVFPLDSSEWLDTDSDGVGDNSDAFPLDSTETLDTDLDGRGNNADRDDDNDGVDDEFDLDPLDPNKGIIPTQIVSVKGNPSGLIGQNVSIDVEYDVNDGDSSLTGLGLRIHFDSRVLSINSLTNVLSESNFYTESIPKDDSNDLDNDIITDMYLEIGWAAIFGDWPGVIPTELVTLNFDVTQQAPESTRLNFSSSSSSAGYSFEGISYDLDIVNATWDFDSNGKADALTDGLLLLRYTFGLRGDALLASAIAHDSPLTSEQVQENVSASVSSIADIDNSSNVDALTDGLLLLRYLFGLSGDSLINSSVAINAERTTATEIEDYIQSLMP